MEPSATNDRIAALQEELDELRAALPGGRTPTEGTSPSPTDSVPTDSSPTRRRLLGGAVAGAAAVVAGAVAASQPAAATVGAMQYGASNDAGSATTTLTSGPPAANPVLSVTSTTPATAILGASTDSYGVAGQSSTGAAIFGKCFSYGYAGLFDNKDTTGRGLLIRSNVLHLQFSTIGTRNPPTEDASAPINTMVADSGGNLWYTVAGGSPATYRKLTGPAAAGAFHVLPAPARVYDSRAGSSPSQGPKTPLSGNTARTIDLKVNSSGVPAGATAALLTVLLVDAANANGTLTVWAAGVARPASNTLVWGGSAGRFTTSTVTALDAQARCQVAASASTNVVIDVVGYYR